jgi:hypothetical protein
MQDFSIDQIEFRKRIEAMNARREAEALAQKEKNRADRKAGLLTQGVINGFMYPFLAGTTCSQLSGVPRVKALPVKR